MQENFIGASTLYRRAALDLVTEGFRTKDAMQPADYKIAQMLAQFGWKFAKHSVPLLYRAHADSSSVAFSSERSQLGYPLTHGLGWQPITLFIPLSGRMFAWEKQVRWLEQQTFPKDRLRLILCDNSQNAEFGKGIRRWVSECDYQDVRYFQFAAGEPGLADQFRGTLPMQDKINSVMCRIYNRMRTAIETDYVMILEDDIIPPLDVIDRLIAPFAVDVVAVAAPYRSRHTGLMVAWKKETYGRRLVNVSMDQGVSEIDATGFGCVLMRSSIIRDRPFTYDSVNAFDHDFWLKATNGKKLLMNWNCPCEHLQSHTSW